MQQVTIFWFRRDLRLDDNAGLYHALKSGVRVQPVFIFDTEILDKLSDKKDRRVTFIHERLNIIQEDLKRYGSSLRVFHGKPEEVWSQILVEFNVNAVYTNHDYEPYARKRDREIGVLLEKKSIPFYTCKDQVIFEKNEILKDDGKPYTVFTPYKNKWRKTITDYYLKPYPVEKYSANYNYSTFVIPALGEIGFMKADDMFPENKVSDELIRHYHEKRDIPSFEGTSRLSVHLRFGTVSIRKLVKHAWNLSDQWVNELIWREFYMQILWHFPHVVNGAFKKEYDHIPWRNNEDDFKKWCEGKTGYPIVDAGMRELNTTGFMHNRVRMVVSSFLTKHLLIDWKWGEAYFAEKLIDFELSSNNGGWQWAAGTGTDAAPYFRIFNPQEQQKKFDPEFRYIRKWLPEFGSSSYPAPIVDHKFARERCLNAYKTGLNKT